MMSRSPGETVKEKAPALSVETPFVLLRIRTEAASTGSPFSFFTVPETGMVCWACAISRPKEIKKSKNAFWAKRSLAKHSFAQRSCGTKDACIYDKLKLTVS